MKSAFEREHERIFGYASPEEKIEIVNIRLTAKLGSARAVSRRLESDTDGQYPDASRRAYFGPQHGWMPAKVLRRDQVGAHAISGPAIVEQYDTTVVVPPGATLHADGSGNLVIDCAQEQQEGGSGERYDAGTREIVRHALEALADEMALTIIRTCRSGHVKHSGDFSTAIADGKGQLLAQGVTSPFHLGAMPDALEAILRDYRGRIFEGDVFVLNDPFNGGMHLPDIL